MTNPNFQNVIPMVIESTGRERSRATIFRCCSKAQHLFGTPSTDQIANLIVATAAVSQ